MSGDGAGRGARSSDGRHLFRFPQDCTIRLSIPPGVRVSRVVFFCNSFHSTESEGLGLLLLFPCFWRQYSRLLCSAVVLFRWWEVLVVDCRCSRPELHPPTTAVVTLTALNRPKAQHPTTSYSSCKLSRGREWRVRSSQGYRMVCSTTGAGFVQ